MKQYKAILFDLDGTLLDTSEGVISSVQYTIDTLGYKKLDVGQNAKFYRTAGTQTFTGDLRNQRRGIPACDEYFPFPLRWR